MWASAYTKLFVNDKSKRSFTIKIDLLLLHLRSLYFTHWSVFSYHSMRRPSYRSINTLRSFWTNKRHAHWCLYSSLWILLSVTFCFHRLASFSQKKKDCKINKICSSAAIQEKMHSLWTELQAGCRTYLLNMKLICCVSMPTELFMSCYANAGVLKLCFNIYYFHVLSILVYCFETLNVQSSKLYPATLPALIQTILNTVRIQ